MNKKILFLTESNWTGKIEDNFLNMRTEYCWMKALDAFHMPLTGFNPDFIDEQQFDWVFIIWPKKEEFYTLKNNKGLEITRIILSFFGSRNIKIAFVQEGPHNYFEDYKFQQQELFYEVLLNSDLILAHNVYDLKYFKGLLPDSKLMSIIPTLMYTNLIDNIQWNPIEKTILGGNLCNWYGGFKSYIIAKQLTDKIFVPQSGRYNKGEEKYVDILPWTNWYEWIKQLSTFKYAVHMMPTVAAGTFALNCAYFGIPCIGNKNVDTQAILFPDLSFDVEDVYEAKIIAKDLKEDEDFYDMVSKQAKDNFKKYYSIEQWKEKIDYILNEVDKIGERKNDK